MRPTIKEQTTCTYCATTFDKDHGFCPLCRRRIVDLSGRHIQLTPQPKQVPLTYSIPDKVSVSIKRAKGGSETFKGTVTHETTTHYRVQSLAPYNINEWFAKASDRVNCYPLRPEGESSQAVGKMSVL